MILIDTDIIIDYLRQNEKALSFIKGNEDNITISNFTKIELIVGCKNKIQIDNLEIFLNNFSTVKINTEIIDNSIDILKNHYLKDGIEAIDAIIASTAIYYDLDFYSKNIKHYKNIKELKLYKAY